MALEKAKNYKGISCNYWRINSVLENDITDEITVTLGLYADSSTASGDVASNIMDETEVSFQNFSALPVPPGINPHALGVRNTVKTILYTQLKESRMEWVPVLDGDGNPTYNPDGSMITEYAETNFFVDAVDV